MVNLGGSHHMKLGASIARISVAAPDIADVAAFPPDQLFITGKRLGQTTATVWTKQDETMVLTVVVGLPTDLITGQLRAAIPDGKDLKVDAAGSSLVISGEVTSVGDSEKAEQLVAGYAATLATRDHAPTLVNLLRVSGDQQVQLEVSFAEVSRTALKQIGLNFWQKGQAGDYAGGQLAPTTGLANLAPKTSEVRELIDQLQPNGGLPMVAAPMAGTFGLVFSTAVGTAFPFSAVLSVLSSRGYARTLSEPTLVAMSGKEAVFLAGGEFPLPIVGALGQVNVTYKKYGVQLKFTPTVLGDTIQLDLASTVSDIDFSLGVHLQSVLVPGLTERFSSTTIRLRDGQSFAIAGLLNDKVRSTVDKVPFLGDLPILGTLFRSTSYRRDESELLVVVTARLVRPQGERSSLPGADTTTDPSDLELFFLGSVESKPTKNSTPRQKPAGPVGFKR